MNQPTINRLLTLGLFCLALAVGCLLGFLLDNEETTEVPQDPAHTVGYVDVIGHEGESYVVDLKVWCPEADHLCHDTGVPTPEAKPAEPVPMTTEGHDHE